ncbi:MAG: DUF1592 domain-containing protein, partial [Polyangiaceae bacterium]
MKRTLISKTGAQLALLVPCFLTLVGCTAAVNGNSDDIGPMGSSGSNSVGSAGAGNIAGAGPVSGGGTGSGSSGSGTGSTGSTLSCPTTPTPNRAPMRRLTQFEFNNTLKDLKLDSTDLALNLPAEDLTNGFGNDTDSQSASTELIKQYQAIGEAVGANVTKASALATLLPCSTNVTSATEASCARTFIQDIGPKAFRRPLETAEADSYASLFTSIRATSGSTFASSIAAIVEAILQDPALLYRPEFGVPVAGRTDLLRPTGYEMATRLSYALWGTTPDDSLRAAAAAGQLDTAEGVNAQASLMLGDPRTKNQVRFFFDNLLPIASLSQLERTDSAYNSTSSPTLSKLGSLMRQETETFLEHTVFDGNGGTWPSVFTAD